MPYMKVTEGNKIKVYKKGPDGQPMGKMLGEHDSDEQAQAHIAAMMANEDEDSKEAGYTKCMGEPMMMEPMMAATSFDELEAAQRAEEAAMEAHRTTSQFQMLARNILHSMDISDKTAALGRLASDYASRIKGAMQRKEQLSPPPPSSQPEDLLPAGEAGLHTREAWTTAFVNSLPDSSFLYVEPGGEKDGEGKTAPRSLRHLPVRDSSGKVDLPHLRNAIARIPQMAGVSADKKASLQGRARKMLESANKENSLLIWKEGGVYKWVAAYSNNYRDEDNPPEIISTQSHKEFDEALEKGEWPMPELWLWHIPYRVGEANLHTFDEETGFTLAAGTFDKGMEWAAEGIVKAGWDGVSHGMPSKEIQRDIQEQTVIIRHRSKEISPLPSWAAANKLSFNIISKEYDMGIPAHKREEFIKAFGAEKVDEMEKALEGKAAQAKEAGIEQKEQEAATPEAAPTTEAQPAIDPQALAQAITTAVTTLLAPVIEEVKGLQAEVKELKKTDAQKVAEKAAATPAASLEALVIESIFGKATQIDGRSSLAQSKPKEAETKKNKLFFEDWMQPGS